MRFTPLILLGAYTLTGICGAALAQGAAVPSPAAATTADIVALVREFGFPIFVVIWFMWRMERRIDKYTEQIEKLYTIVTVLVKTIDGNEHQE